MSSIHYIICFSVFLYSLCSVWPMYRSLCRYPKDTKPKFNNPKSKKACSFHEFARSTNDAWDIEDEEDEDFLVTPAPTSSLPSGLHPTSTHNQVATWSLFHKIKSSHESVWCWCLVWSLSSSIMRLVTQKAGCQTDWHLTGQKVKTSMMCRRKRQTVSTSMARLSSLIVRPTSTLPQVCG